MHSKVNSTVSLGPDESAEVLDVFNDIASDLHPTSPKPANAAFGVARQPSISRLKGPSRRDSPTLPWRTNSQRSTSGALNEVKTNGKPLTPAPPPRPDSPDIETILAKTPRPRKNSTSLVTPSRARSSQSLRRSAKQDENDDLLDDRSLASVSEFGNLLEDIDSGSEDGDGTGSMTTKSGLFKDPRDTQRRRIRHRDGQLLKAGMGLTTGLGWSDRSVPSISKLFSPSSMTLTSRFKRGRRRAVCIDTTSHIDYDRKETERLDNIYPSKFRSPIPEAVAFPSEPASSKTIPSSAPPNVLKMRSRADSAASTATTRSVSSIATPVASLPRRKESMDCLKPGIQISRVRKDSSLSTSASTSSLASTYSQHSTSTTSSGSVVPRPLRLPQEAAMKAPSRTFSQDFGLTSSPPSWTGDDATLKYQRLRALSNPPSETRPQTVSAQRSLSTSQSLESGVLPPGSPPTLRQRQVPNGARPRPRTGTGMVYRTSSHSYASFHESGSKMRNMSIPAGDGVMPAF
ncbi:hypothetical protein EIP86_000685 [Pleurotus ostreatoroseus]|nr:hypothetical protein EIP86_000685 [Pleurotus ostreatoroseus]